MTSLLETKNLRFEHLPERKAILATATGTFIPRAEFTEAFETLLSKLAEAPNADTLIFDKRPLRTFDQDSMVWYHVDWKERAYRNGIVHHIKLLPTDKTFRKSVEIGRQKIMDEHPDFDFARYDIRYLDSIEEALPG